jgi:hypothetical protein
LENALYIGQILILEGVEEEINPIFDGVINLFRYWQK